MPDIPGERARLSAQGLVIERRETWGATFNYTGERAVQRPAEAIFLHIAVVESADGGPDASPADERVVARLIEQIGIERFPATGISYNAIGFQSGRLYEGQPLTRRGAHTLNEDERHTCPVHGTRLDAPSWNLNVTGRALVLPQRVGDVVTDAQVDAAARWAAAGIRAGEIRRGARWCGHRCVSNKDCPGSRGYARIPEIQALTEGYVAAGLPADGGNDMLEADFDRIETIVNNRVEAIVNNRVPAVLRDVLMVQPFAPATDPDEQVRGRSLAGLALVAARWARAGQATAKAAGDAGQEVSERVTALVGHIAGLTQQVQDLDLELSPDQATALAGSIRDALPAAVLSALVELLQHSSGAPAGS